MVERLRRRSILSRMPRDKWAGAFRDPVADCLGLFVLALVGMCARQMGGAVQCDDGLARAGRMKAVVAELEARVRSARQGIALKTTVVISTPLESEPDSAAPECFEPVSCGLTHGVG